MARSEEKPKCESTGLKRAVLTSCTEALLLMITMDRKFDSVKPRVVCIQPFNRTPSYWSLTEAQRRRVTERTRNVYMNYEADMDFQIIQCLGLSEAEYIQLVEFPFENLSRFHEFMKAWAKTNALYFELEHVVSGITGLSDYTAFFALTSSDEIPSALRSRFVSERGAFLPPSNITEAEMKMLEEHLQKSGRLDDSVWEYIYRTYGADAFKNLEASSTKKFNGPRIMSLKYCRRSPEWWALPEEKRQAVMMKHSLMLTRYLESVDPKLVFLMGTAKPDFIAIEEFPAENLAVFHRLMKDVMKIDSPYLVFDKVYTGLCDYPETEDVSA